jgi:hypothetical protein
MAAGDSVVSICNIALIALGELPITSVFPPDNTKRAILCAQRYDDTRRFVLRTGLWSCAKQQAVLAAAPAGPLFTYGFAYQLPADFNRMIDLPENDHAQWEVFGAMLLTDEGPPLDVVYGRDLQDPALFDPGLVHSIAYSLAAELGMPITNSATKVQQALKTLEGKLDAGRLADSQQNSPKEWDVDVLLRSRFP